MQYQEGIELEGLGACRKYKDLNVFVQEISEDQKGTLKHTSRS